MHAAADRSVDVHQSALADLDVHTLYALLRLRTDVFVVEQNCAYPELDGRDNEPGTRHIWLVDDTGPTAYLRLLAEPDGRSRRIGRVCTRADVRGRGLAAALMGAALGTAGSQEVVLDAQSHLAAWYQRLGFAQCGPEFVEDGIPHVPMRRPAPTVRA